MLKLVFKKKYRRLLISICLLLVGYTFVDNYFSKSVQLFTNQKAQQFATRSIEQAIRNTIIESDDIKDIVNIYYKGDGIVSNVSVNTQKVNSLLANASKELYQTVNDLENSKNKELSLPLGYLVSRSFFTNFGPVVTINLKPIGSVKIDCMSSVTPNGLNNTLLEISLKVKLDFLVLIPMQSQELSIESFIPLVVEVMSGNIPQFYYQGSTSFTPTLPSLNI